MVAQEVSEMGARLHGGFHGARVDGERDHGHAEASSIARRSTATWMCRSAASATPALVRIASATRGSNCA